MTVQVWPSWVVHTCSTPMSHFIIPPASYLLLFMRGAEPWSPCSLISILIMLPGNNMHFIFCPSCLYHSHHHPPLHPVLFLISTSSILSSTPSLCSSPPFVSPRLAVVSDLCGSPGSYERKTSAPHARELHYTSGPTRYTVIIVLIF